MDEKNNLKPTTHPRQCCQETVTQIPLSDLHPFPHHPFKVREDEAMRGMIESIREYGVLTPILLRPRPESGFEIISGHRRKCACEEVGLETIPAIIRDLDDDTATILMVDSNIQRENILPSEKALAYKMKLEAIKRQGSRTDLTSDQVGQKWSVDRIAEESGESKTQIQRYIRLNELSPQLKNMVDSKDIPMTPAVEISYLKPEEQSMLVETMAEAQVVPTLSQAQRLKKDSQAGKLNRESIRSIMVADDIAHLKDPTKDCRCTPDIFLEAFNELANRYCREIEVFTIPYYEEVFPILTTAQLDALHQQIDSIHAAANKFYNQVKGLNQCEQSTKQEL